jgi:hypothetical protein
LKRLFNYTLPLERLYLSVCPPVHLHNP